MPTNANVFFAIYQAIIAGSDDDGDATSSLAPKEQYVNDGQEISDNQQSGEKGFYRQYDPEFFDIIIIDECHR